MTRHLLLAAWAAAAAGCGPGPPRPADPDAARATLVRALDAWKRGDAPAALLAATPPVTAVDRAWQRGDRLLSYDPPGTAARPFTRPARGR